MTFRTIAHFLYYRLFSAFCYAPLVAPCRGIVNRTPWLRILRRLPVHGIIPVEAHGLCFLYRADKRDLIGRNIFWQGFEAYEPETFAFLIPRIDKRTLFIDAGANTGLFSLVACAKGAAHVVAVEPVRRIFNCLAANIAANGFDDRVALIPAALGNHDGEVMLNDPGGYVFPTSASLLEGGWGGMAGTEVNVPLKRLDTVLASLGKGILEGIDRIVLKIDVEGVEIDVLRGFENHLANHAVEIVFEANDAEFLRPAREFLVSRGFTVSQITPDGLIPADAADFSGHRQLRNFYAQRVS